MSSESEDEDFLSADEGENDEKSTESSDDTAELKIKDNRVAQKSLINESEEDDEEKEIEQRNSKEDEVLEVNYLGKDVKEMEILEEDLSKLETKHSITSHLETTVSREVDEPSIDANSNEREGETSCDVKCNENENIKSQKPGNRVTDKESIEKKTSEPIKLGEALNTGAENYTKNSVKAPIKESKIGMKKPREKLGERLGTKKLGSRITKPLVGISSDSIMQQKCSDIDNKKIQSSQMDRKLNVEEMKPDPVRVDNEVIDSTEDGSIWGSWGDWGSTIVNAASTLTVEVTRGVGTVLDTVESGLGAPNPEDLAREMVEREKMTEQTEVLKQAKAEEPKREFEEENLPVSASTDDTQPQSYGFGLSSFGTLVSGVSGALESASNKVLLGGLDTLEKIGRKTMDIIQEGDPGLRRKRAFLNSNKPNLSLVLREARERAISEETNRNSSTESKDDRLNYVSMALVWDSTEGPVHMEALSLISKQCEAKTFNILQEIPPVYSEPLKEKITKIKSCSHFEEDDKVENIDSKLMEITRDVQLPLQFNKVLTGWPSLQEFLSKLSIEICGLGNTDFVTLQKDLYRAIAEYICLLVGVIHKAAELALITPELNAVRLAQQFQRICGCISGGLEKSADGICESISQALSASDPEFNDTITNIYVQMAEVNSYLESSLADLSTVLIQTEAKRLISEL